MDVNYFELLWQVPLAAVGFMVAHAAKMAGRQDVHRRDEELEVELLNMLKEKHGHAKVNVSNRRG